jgi:Fe-S-cluster containining protein
MGSEVCFNICKECLQHQESCCKGNSVPLTRADIERIAALGHDPADFLIAGEYGAEFVKGFEPWWDESFVRGERYLYKLNTATRADGHCVFLIDGKGCILGEHRPFVCRIYPFWVDDSGKVVYEPEERESCFIPKRKISVDQALAYVGEDRAAVIKYHTEIKKDSIENRQFHLETITGILRNRPEVRAGS